jgi:CBS domain-containing protein
VTDGSDGLTVTEIMRQNVPAAAPADSIATVARLLADNALPGVPVIDGDTLVGIVTESDLVFREADVSVPTVVPVLDAMLVADAGTPFEEDLRRVLALTAGELMTSPVYTIRRTATLNQVATLMVEHRVNPVPVVDESNTLVGIVSRADLVRVIARLEGASTGEDGERAGIGPA